MGSSSKRAPVPPPLAFDGGASTVAAGAGSAPGSQQPHQEQPAPQQYQQNAQYQQDGKEQEPYYYVTECYSQYSTSPPSYSSQETPRSTSSEYFSSQSAPSGNGKRKSSHSGSRKGSSPTVNQYTYCGRHSNEWLFNNHGFSDLTRLFSKKEEKSHKRDC